MSIEDWEDTVQYYRALGSNGEKIPDEVWLEEFLHLTAALKKSGTSFQADMYVVAAFTELGAH